MATETQTPLPITTPAPVSESCDFATYLDQGVGSADEVSEMAREVMVLTDDTQPPQSLAAQTTTELATTITELAYPGTKRDKLITTLETNTRRTVSGALAGAYIAQNCVACPVADSCNLLQALRSQYDEGLVAKGENETMAFVVTARRLAETIKPKFTSIIMAQQRIDTARDPSHKISDIMRANDKTRGGISRVLMSPANKPYRNESLVALRQLLEQDPKGEEVVKKADEDGVFGIFDGIAVEAFIGDAVAASDMVAEVKQATRAQDVTEGTDFFFEFIDRSGKPRSVRVDAKSAGKFKTLKDEGSVKRLKVGDDRGHFGVKSVDIKDSDGSTHKEPVLVICPTGERGDIDSSFDATRLPETGCVSLEQTPNEAFTHLIDEALITFVKRYLK